MAEPYVGEIRMFAGTFAPREWRFCNGDLISISEYDVLYSLLGTTYGGDGQQTFALPDLRGRLPIGQSGIYPIGAKAGAETVTLTSQQIPAHTHALSGSTGNGSQGSPANNVLASSTKVSLYASETPDTPMAATSIGFAGGGAEHTNVQPYLCVNFIISLSGVYPPRN